MGNWMMTLLERKAGLSPHHIGDNESHEDFAERQRVTVVPDPPGPRSGPATPPGWHPDPYKAHEVRFFDGVEWTEHVADDGKAAVDPVPAPVS